MVDVTRGVDRKPSVSGTHALRLLVGKIPVRISSLFLTSIVSISFGVGKGKAIASSGITGLTRTSNIQDGTHRKYWDASWKCVSILAGHFPIY